MRFTLLPRSWSVTIHFTIRGRARMDHEGALVLRRTQWGTIAIFAGGVSSGFGPGLGPGRSPRVTSRVGLARWDGTRQLLGVSPEYVGTLLPAHERVSTIRPEVLFFLYWVHAMHALGADRRDCAEQEKPYQAKLNDCYSSHNDSPSICFIASLFCLFPREIQ